MMSPKLAAEKNPDWWFVMVLEDEREKINQMGRARNQNGKTLGWTSKTADLTDEWNLSGIRAEWAVSLCLNLPIGRITSQSVKELNQGDLSDWIEVKSSRGAEPFQWDLICNEDQLKRERAYVHAITCWWPEWVVVTGWAWGEELITQGRRTKHGANQHGIFVLPQRSLKPFDSFFPVLRERQRWSDL